MVLIRGLGGLELDVPGLVPSALLKKTQRK